MHLARYEHLGVPWWGFVEGARILPAPTGAGSLVDALRLSARGLGEVRQACAEAIDLAAARLLAPVAAPPQFIGVGLNYRDHAAEAGLDVPDAPVTFPFLASAVLGPGQPIVIPPFTNKVDWEVELGIVVGSGGRDIPAGEALARVAGYTLVNDVSARDVQKRDGQWSRSKSFDTFKPMGPWITTVDELGAAGDLTIELWINDVLKQSSTTAEMVFTVPEIVAFASRSTTLQPGAVITTGTPPGVGYARDPREYLRPGDVVTMEIEGIGRMSNPVVATA